jgi:hypothetical protein
MCTDVLTMWGSFRQTGRRAKLNFHHAPTSCPNNAVYALYFRSGSTANMNTNCCSYVYSCWLDKLPDSFGLSISIGPMYNFSAITNHRNHLQKFNKEFVDPYPISSAIQPTISLAEILSRPGTARTRRLRKFINLIISKVIPYYLVTISLRIDVTLSSTRG